MLAALMGASVAARSSRGLLVVGSNKLTGRGYGGSSYGNNNSYGLSNKFTVGQGKFGRKSGGLNRGLTLGGYGGRSSGYGDNYEQDYSGLNRSYGGRASYGSGLRRGDISGLGGLRDQRDTRDLGNLRGVQQTRDTRDLGGLRDTRDTRDLGNTRGLFQTRDTRDLGGLRDTRDTRDLGNIRGIQ